MTTLFYVLRMFYINSGRGLERIVALSMCFLVFTFMYHLKLLAVSLKTSC